MTPWPAELAQIQSLWGRIQSFLVDRSLMGNSVGQWVLAFGVGLVTWLVLRVATAIARRRTAAFVKRWKEEWAELAAEVPRQIRFWFLIAIALYAASLVLELPPKPTRVLQSVVVIAFLLQAAIWGNAILSFVISRYVQQRMEVDATGATTVSALGFLARVVLWTVVALMALDSAGVPVTTLIAGLGVGGVAVALAAQNILGDLFASLSIVLDKPFVLGDFIIVDDKMGTVEYIGLKTTRVRSLSGEQLVFANGDLLKTRIRNFKRMRERRILFTFGVVYQTPHEKLKQIPQLVREAIEAQPQTRFDRAHFQGFGDFALLFEVVYYMLTPDYNAYMDVQQQINLQLYERLGHEGIEFAYPTQMVYLRSTHGDGQQSS